MTTAVSILTADWHFSDQAPAFRARESDWYDAMRRSFGQVTDLACELKCPVVLAGDVFNHWRAPPSLINLAIEVLRKAQVYVVRGQHDLPNHSHTLIKRSAYWTLVKARAVTELLHGKPVGVGPFQLWGFSWGKRMIPPASHSLCKNVAVVHKYVWTDGTGFPGAPKESKLTTEGETGYDVVVYGDNHTPFELQDGKGCLHFNCGSLMRRTADQKQHKPSAGILYDDGHVERFYLNCGADVCEEQERPRALFSFGGKADKKRVLDFEAELFREAEKRKEGKGVVTLLTEALDDAQRRKL